MKKLIYAERKTVFMVLAILAVSILWNAQARCQTDTVRTQTDTLSTQVGHAYNLGPAFKIIVSEDHDPPTRQKEMLDDNADITAITAPPPDASNQKPETLPVDQIFRFLIAALIGFLFGILVGDFSKRHR